MPLAAATSDPLHATDRASLDVAFILVDLTYFTSTIRAFLPGGNDFSREGRHFKGPLITNEVVGSPADPDLCPGFCRKNPGEAVKARAGVNSRLWRTIGHVDRESDIVG